MVTNGQVKWRIKRQNIFKPLTGSRFITSRSDHSFFMTIVNSTHNDRHSYMCYLAKDHCYSNRINLDQVGLTELIGCGLLYLRSKRIRKGDDIEISYFPTDDVKHFDNGFALNWLHGTTRIIIDNIDFIQTKLTNDEYVLTIKNVDETRNGPYRVQCTNRISPENVSTNTVEVDVLACRSGWDLYGNDTCFYYQFASLFNYDMAVTYCADLQPGSHLLTIENGEEDSYIEQVLIRTLEPTATNFVTFIWMGISERSGSWKYEHNHESVTYFNWYPGEPSKNYQGILEECGNLFYRENRQWTWNDGECAADGYAICRLDINKKNSRVNPGGGTGGDDGLSTVKIAITGSTAAAVLLVEGVVVILWRRGIRLFSRKETKPGACVTESAVPGNDQIDGESQYDAIE